MGDSLYAEQWPGTWRGALPEQAKPSPWSPSPGERCTAALRCCLSGDGFAGSALRPPGMSFQNHQKSFRQEEGWLWS